MQREDAREHGEDDRARGCARRPACAGGSARAPRPPPRRGRRRRPRAPLSPSMPPSGPLRSWWVRATTRGDAMRALRRAWRRRSAARCSGVRARAAAANRAARSSSARHRPRGRRDAPWRLCASAVVTHVRTTTGRCIHERVCILASASTIAAAFGGCQGGISAKPGKVAITASYQGWPCGGVGRFGRHHARQERRVAGDVQHVRLEPLDLLRVRLGSRRERPDFAEPAPHRQPVQPVDRPRDAAGLHHASRRQQQLLASRERLRRHAREQQLEPRQARRAREARGVLAQRVGARRRARLGAPRRAARACCLPAAARRAEPPAARPRRARARDDRQRRDPRGAWRLRLAWGPCLGAGRCRLRTPLRRGS